MNPSFAAWSLLALAWNAAAATQFYQWKDANGVSHYTEAPPDGRR